MIHPTAVIHPGAKLGDNVSVGPYCVIGEHVEVGEGTWIGPHVVLDGHTRIGRDNRIFPFSSLGGEPQDKKYKGEPTALEIGDRNTIREYCTINSGTVQDAGVTRLGDDNWIMGYVHIAHDCHVGSNTIFASNAQIAGHVHVGDWAILGGMAGVHQFVKIGAHAMTGGGTILLQDIPPFVMVAGNPAAPHGINSEGLKRRGFSEEAITALRRAYKSLYRSGLGLAEAIETLSVEYAHVPEVQVLTEFLRNAKRGIVR
ncbi:MAG TPA: acyl-ACP--UDP-N-acetylglucosamine O-acyltransferase [Burkholderiales bacterium]|nr:acyl-ACP--UDP-N-acetylglucosamine O-acyltransferase [Burkholderiales bacterium]